MYPLHFGSKAQLRCWRHNNVAAIAIRGPSFDVDRDFDAPTGMNDP
jgi:hypothetical protein